MTYKIAPSVLSANFAKLGDDVMQTEQAGADYIHVDVMDGRFVPNITIGPPVVSALKQATKLPLDVHLMIVEPERYIEDFVQAGASILTLHVEACTHLHRAVEKIKSLGCKAGVSLNPSTSLFTIEEILPYIDLVLVMSVNPGFGGQSFVPTSLDKIHRLKTMLAFCNNHAAEIEVDGGIKADNIKSVKEAGANVFVAGSAIFNKHHSIADGIKNLRQALT